MAKQVMLTKEGLENLKNELENLKTVKSTKDAFYNMVFHIYISKAT